MRKISGCLISGHTGVYATLRYTKSSTRIPLLLKAWFCLLALWALSYTSYTSELRGLRIGHSFYYIEFLFPFAFLSILRKPKFLKQHRAICAFGLWLLSMGIIGVYKGNLPSLIYDRSRNWAGMVLLLLLLHRYQITSRQLIQLLMPVFIAAMIGYPMAIVFPVILFGNIVSVKDSLGFNFMAAAFIIGEFVLYRKLRWWGIFALVSAFVVPVFMASRAKLLSITVGLLLPSVCSMRRNLVRNISISTTIVIILLIITLSINTSEQFEGKSIRGGGFQMGSLVRTSEARLSEYDAILYQMELLDYLVGKGTGSTWDGQELYIGESGLERQVFHIYYFEIVYCYGLVGLLLWYLVGVSPIIKGIIQFHRLNAIGVMGVCSQTALLLAWFGHAGYTIAEGSYIAVSLYALHCGNRAGTKS